MNFHTLKIHETPFADLLSGAKTCEIRSDDRGFEVGDTVELKEFDGSYTGRAIRRTISHIQRGYGLPDGLCVLSYAPEWIPVTERLPTAEDGVVAVLTDDGGILTAWASYWSGARTDFACWTFPHPDDDDSTVTHWAPVPAALTTGNQEVGKV